MFFLLALFSLLLLCNFDRVVGWRNSQGGIFEGSKEGYHGTPDASLRGWQHGQHEVEPTGVGEEQGQWI